MADASQMKFVIQSPQYRPRMIPFRVIAPSNYINLITFQSGANTDQADFILITGNGFTVAAWFNIDGDGTEPTADEYVNADTQAPIAIASTDTAIDIAGIFAAAFGAGATDNLDGTVTITEPGSTTNYSVQSFNADGSGAGTMTVTETQAGSPISLAAGKFDATISEDNPNEYTITFNEPFLRAPEVGILSITDNAVPRILDSTEFLITVSASLVTDGSSLAFSGSLLVIGSDSPDAILNEN